MAIDKVTVIGVLAKNIPSDILNVLLTEFSHIRQQFFLKKYQPSELNGARFGECVLRLLEYLDTGAYTPFGTQLSSSDGIIKKIENNTALPNTFRFFIPRLVRVILDVRNKRDVAHVGGEVSPNYSDSLLVVHATDWILTELVRHYHTCTIDEASQIVKVINEPRIPIVADVDGFLRIQNTKLSIQDRVLVILFYKRPQKVLDADISKWCRYQNISRFRKDILTDLDKQALIHYENGFCTLLDRGVIHIEKNIPLELIV